MSTATRPTHQRLVADVALLTEALDALEMVGCQFWACEGPTLRPKPMVTCDVCGVTARLRRRLGKAVRQGIEGSIHITEARRLADLHRATRQADGY
jgi:hypothetical protein